MATLTARVRVTLPAKIKAELRECARMRGVKLSALVREITADVVIEQELAVTLAQIEQHGAAIQ